MANGVAIVCRTFMKGSKQYLWAYIENEKNRESIVLKGYTGRSGWVYKPLMTFEIESRRAAYFDKLRAAKLEDGYVEGLNVEREHITSIEDAKKTIDGMFGGDAAKHMQAALASIQMSVNSPFQTRKNVSVSDLAYLRETAPTHVTPQDRYANLDPSIGLY